MSKAKNNVNDLLATIKRQPTIPGPKQPEAGTLRPIREKAESAATQERPKKVGADTKTKSRRGKPSQFWFHDDDRKIVRELSAWLAGQGVRPTDSLVIRAVLRTAKTGGFSAGCLLAGCKSGRTN